MADLLEARSVSDPVETTGRADGGADADHGALAQDTDVGEGGGAKGTAAIPSDRGMLGSTAGAKGPTDSPDRTSRDRVTTPRADDGRSDARWLRLRLDVVDERLHSLSERVAALAERTSERDRAPGEAEALPARRARVELAGRRSGPPTELGGEAAGPLLEGSLRGLALGTLFTLLEFERRSGLLTLEHGARCITLSLRDGAIARSELDGERTGASQAVQIACGWDHARFEFASTPGDDCLDRPRSANALMLDALRAVDEGESRASMATAADCVPGAMRSSGAGGGRGFGVVGGPGRVLDGLGHGRGRETPARRTAHRD